MVFIQNNKPGLKENFYSIIIYVAKKIATQKYMKNLKRQVDLCKFKDSLVYTETPCPEK